MHNLKDDDAKSWASLALKAKKLYAQPLLESAKKEGHAYFISDIREMEDPEQIAKDYALGIYSCITPAYLPSLQELADLLGDEWLAVSRDARELKGWLETVITNRMIADRVRPPWFTHKAECCRCGSIPLDFTPEEKLVGCPWCHSS